MSRVGKMPVAIPAGVDVSIKADQISVKGAGGTLSLAQSALVTVNNEGGKLSFVPANESREANAMSGTMRQLVNNMVVGVSKGFEKKLTLIGVGYKAQAQGAKLNLSVGFSHPVNIDMPAGITVATAGPIVRAGFIDAPSMGPMTRPITATVMPSATAASAPCARVSVATAMTTSMRIAVMITSMPSAPTSLTSNGWVTERPLAVPNSPATASAPAIAPATWATQ